VIRFELAPALAGLAFLSVCATARAEDIPVGQAPIVNVRVDYGQVNVAVWDRPIVSINSSGAITSQYVPNVLNLPSQITMWAQSAQTLRGPVALPAEPFVLPPIVGTHDGVTVHGDGNTTIMVPQGTALVVARVSGRGGIGISDYQGTLVATTRNGFVTVRNVGGTAYLQSLRGGIVASESSFDRVRARTGEGPVVFTDCQADQIDATSVFGAVLYDNGTLGQGPAQFSSDNDNIGIGIADLPTTEPAQVLNGTSTEMLGPAGPALTVTAPRGAAYVYSGSLAQHPELLSRWPRAQNLMRREPLGVPRRRFGLVRHSL
jgi:hypothetical protein